MAFNLRGAVRGAAETVVQQQGLRISAETQAMRDRQLQKFQVDQMGAQQKFITEQGKVAHRNTLIQNAQKAQIDYATRQITRKEKLEDFTEEQIVKGIHNPDATPAQEQANLFLEQWDTEGVKTLQGLFEESKAAKQLEFDLENVGEVLDYLESEGGTGKIPEILATFDQWTGLQNKTKAAAMEILHSSIMPAILAATMKLKGAISNREIGMIEDAMVNMGNTIQANKLIYDTMRKAQKAAIDNYTSARDHALKEKNLRTWDMPTYTGVYGRRSDTVPTTGAIPQTAAPAQSPQIDPDVAAFDAHLELLRKGGQK